MNRTLHAVVVLAAVMLAANVLAQTSYPDKPVRLIVNNVSGGGVDLTARVVGQKLSETWGRPVVIENFPGAAGNIGAARAAKSPADGYTLLISGDAAMTTNMSMYDRMPYDPTKDFAAISLLTLSTNILVVHPSVPARNLRELVALAKSQPRELSYASAGNGTSQHLGGELLKKMAGINLVHVPYKSAPLAAQDVVAGRVEMTFGNIVNMLPMVQANRLRAIAVSSLKRWPAVPDVPTVAESGYPGFDAVAWFGLLGPAGTPDAITQKVYQDAVKVLSAPDVRTRLTDAGLAPIGSSPAEFTAQIKDEIVKKAQLVKAAGIKAD
jgi:tripartite-type tricarboxylate transporter receptor subunit TctC